jgi:hypothetical protein
MRSTAKHLIALTSVLLLAGSAHAVKPESPGGGKGGGPKTCDPAAVDAATAAIATACPCDGLAAGNGNGDVVPWRNHGKYVRCVAHATKAAVKESDGALTRRCLKTAVRCAARSTCGRADGVVACTTTTGSSCVAGSCGDGSACTTDDDCTASSCAFRRSAAECAAGGGVPGTGSCCAPVPAGSPSGAFVDGAPLL